MTRYVIVGAGAVGSALAAEFHRVGIDSVLVARGKQLRALEQGPLRYLRPDRRDEVDLTIAGGTADVALQTDDILVLAVKAHQAHAALADWAWAPVDGGTTVAAQSIPVVTLQNGLDTERTALRLFETVVGASIWTPATYRQPGTVAVHSPGSAGLVWLGRVPTGVDDLTRSIAADLTTADFPTQPVADIRRWKAAKLLSNLGNAWDVFAADDDERRRLDDTLRTEAHAVFAAAGIDVADPATESTLDVAAFGVAPVPGEGPTRRSTWQSLERGAGSVETDFLNGEIVLLGRQHGVATPANRALQQALGRLVATGSEPETIALRDVVDLREPAPAG